MAEIVNLRIARKQKARDEKAKASAENRALFGRTKAERELEQARAAKARDHLDAHRREPDGDA